MHRKQKSARRFLLLAAGIAIMSCGLTAALFHWICPFFFEIPSSLDQWSPPGMTVVDRQGKPLTHLPGSDHYRSSHLDYESLPEALIDAVLIAEDKRFMKHGGIDYPALVRAVYHRMTGRHSSGASTITQQLVKLSLPRSDRNSGTKFREMMIARRLEMAYGKEFILAAYFNRLDYGNLRLGPSAAAEYYFDRSLDELSLAQLGMLAALPQSPTRLNPRINPGGAMKRRNMILKTLRDEGDYDDERIARALAEPLELAVTSTRLQCAPHLMSKLMRRGKSGIVVTTLDSELQQEAQEITGEVIGSLKERNVSQAAVVVIHNPTGRILAWVGSADRSNPCGGLLDGVLQPRSAGSTLKPFVYALAFDKGHWAGEIIPDVPITFRNSHGYDAPRNYNDIYLGPITAREALACSQNIPAMLMLDKGGGPRALTTLMDQLGFTTLNRSSRHYGLGLAIGNAEVKLLELANAFATLARKGLVKPVYWLEDDAPKEGGEDKRVLNEDICYVITDMLSDDVARAATFGVAGLLAFEFKCAAKTGTSSNFRDNWCIGYTRDITVGVWAGNFDFGKMREVSGISGAGPIFNRVMRKAHQLFPSTFDPAPDGLVRVTIDKRNGFLQNEAFVSRDFLVDEWAFKTSWPRMAETDDYDEQGHALLDSRYQFWYQSPHARNRNGLALAEAQWSGDRAKVVSPPSGSSLALDPELPEQGRWMQLKCNLPQGVQWSSETLNIIVQAGKPVVELKPGTHTVTATHKGLGLECHSTFRVSEL